MPRITKVMVVLVVAALAVTAWRLSRPERSATPDASRTLRRGGGLVASLRSDPRSYNRYTDDSAATEVVSLLTEARLVRVNRSTDQLEPWLAERWSSSDDGLSYTLTLRRGVTFSDGVPLTADDVLFSLEAAYDPTLKSSLGGSLQVAGQPVSMSAPDSHTVVVRLPAPFAPGLRLLESLPILPKHKLVAALTAKTFRDTWTPATPLSTVAGLGPFVLTEHVSGQRLVFSRNPRYFRRDEDGIQLPYLDTLTVLIIPDQNSEALRLQAGEIDLMTNGEIRPQDYAAFERLGASGRLRLMPVGIGLDPDLLWFNLSPAGKPSPGRTLLARREFRQVITHGVDRQALVNGVYLGAAEPIFGPVTPGNKTWFAASASRTGHDLARARSLLTGMGLIDRDRDGTLESAAGVPARFSLLTQSGHIRGRTAVAIQEQLRQLGIAVDLVTLDPRGLVQRFQAADYDSIYFAIQSGATDPAMNLDFWLSSGNFHFWNPRQATPATTWEARIDTLMQEFSRTGDLRARQRALAEVQRIMSEELPAIYFVAPRVTVATTARVLNAQPALQLPQLLWSADTLASSAAAAPTR